MITKKSSQDIIDELHSHFLRTGQWPIAKEFRVWNEESFDLLDDMKEKNRIDIRNDRYELPLHHLRQSKYWPKEKSYVNRLLPDLKDIYRAKFSAQVTIQDILAKGVLGIYGEELQRVLFYLDRANLLERIFPRLKWKVHPVRPR